VNSLEPTEWHGAPAVKVLARRGDQVETIFHYGDVDDVRPLASVTKALCAVALGTVASSSPDFYERPTEIPGATIAHLLSHASGLGLELDSPRKPVGEQRIYSNAGIDLAVSYATAEPVAWLEGAVLGPLGMTTTQLVDRPSAGAKGSAQDLAAFAGEILLPSLRSEYVVEQMETPFLADLSGIVPGFGRFTPCPWGLGLEIRGEKQHWMGEWPADSVGHFGQSGALVLANRRAGVAVVATSTEPFGPWAREAWPLWTSNVFAFASQA
jgi:CubicO group peptidase (beta-lactamase class C family)